MTDPNSAGRYAYFETFELATEKKLIALDFVVRLAQNPSFTATLEEILNVATVIEQHLFPEPADEEEEEEDDE
jgi:uncharacterized protein YciW